MKLTTFLTITPLLLALPQRLASKLDGPHYLEGALAVGNLQRARNTKTKAPTTSKERLQMVTRSARRRERSKDLTIWKGNL
jgi:hypothetical protein